MCAFIQAGRSPEEGSAISDASPGDVPAPPTVFLPHPRAGPRGPSTDLGENARLEPLRDTVSAAWPFALQSRPREWGHQRSGSLRIAAELDGAGNVTSRFIYGNATNVPDLIVRVDGSGNPLYRVITDHLGSPLYIVNLADPADVLLDASYDEWGNITAFTSPDGQWPDSGRCPSASPGAYSTKTRGSYASVRATTTLGLGAGQRRIRFGGRAFTADGSASSLVVEARDAPVEEVDSGNDHETTTVTILLDRYQTRGLDVRDDQAVLRAVLPAMAPMRRSPRSSSTHLPAESASCRLEACRAPARPRRDRRCFIGRGGSARSAALPCPPHVDLSAR